MREALPTILLTRLMTAPAEQYDAVLRILGIKAAGASRPGDEKVREDERPTTEEVARSAFALVVRLDAEGKFEAPSPLTVFRLYCVDGYSADRVARKCRCAKGTVMSRLRFIEEATKTRPADFRAMSGHLQRLDDELSASGAREIYRRGLANETDE